LYIYLNMETKFYTDLKEGVKYEYKLLDHIEHIKYKKMEGYFKEYDMKIYHKNKRYKTYEVKSDKQINIYGNICIEYMCKNKPSGITTSTASYWAIFEPNGVYYRLYIIPTKIIKDYIQNKKYFKDTNGGDYKASKLYLFKKELFEDYIIFSNMKKI